MMLRPPPCPMQRLHHSSRAPGRCRCTLVPCRASKQQCSSQRHHQLGVTQQQQQQICSAAAAAVAAYLLLCSSASAAADTSFAIKCAGCHVNGGNIVQPSATLFTSDLQKNNVADAESLYTLIYSGRERMPGFGTDCAPKGKCTFGPRLSDEEIRELAQYVLDRAAQDWRQ